MKKISFLITVVLITSISAIALAVGEFSDVNSAHPYQEAINHIADEGIVEGYGDGTYQPYKTLSRSELLKIVIEAVYESEFESFGGETCFTDVPDGEWFTKYVCFAKSEGIVAGYGDGSFKPSAKISFVEALKIAMESFAFEENTESVWYQGYVELAGDKNLVPLSVQGFNDEFSRGQMAELITRILKYNEGSLDNYLGDKSSVSLSYSELESVVNDGVDLDGVDQCFDNNSCNENEFCIKDTCVEKSSVLPDNEDSSLANCDFDEVFIDGGCEKAKYSVAFYSIEALGVDFDDYIDESMGAFIALTGMSACPEKIKIIRKPEYCLPNEQDIGKALFDEIGGEMPYFWIYSDPEYQSSECSNFIGESLVAGTLSVDLTSGAVHEVGHTAGLWDQYCYFPDDNNPNIADFEEASCFVADDEWNQWYCGREDLGSSAETAYECEGNFNASGGRTIMGLGGYSLGYNLIGFTEEELEYLAESLNCY